MQVAGPPQEQPRNAGKRVLAQPLLCWLGLHCLRGQTGAVPAHWPLGRKTSDHSWDPANMVTCGQGHGSWLRFLPPQTSALPMWGAAGSSFQRGELVSETPGLLLIQVQRKLPRPWTPSDPVPCGLLVHLPGKTARPCVQPGLPAALPTPIME